MLGVVAGPAWAQIAVRGQGFVPFSEPPINYATGEVDDSVARLQGRIDKGALRLEHDPGRGYLKSVLGALKVPVSSQTLVFSKTSFQYKKISPATPRAIYFNDDVYVGWVRDGNALELASFDARQGAIFYLFDQQKAERPEFERAELDCTQCHVAPGTKGVPGVLLRSIYPTPKGTQAADSTSFLTGHESPLRERFGGWYVTGRHGGRARMANGVVVDREHPERLGPPAGEDVLDLADRFDATPYLSGHSDIVAQLVLAHQTQMHNLITLVNYQARIALHDQEAKDRAEGRAPGPLAAAARRRFEAPADELLKYLLFVDEAPLGGRIEGTSGFSEEFAARGPFDTRGRSLRQFDLDRRLFRYPCSYLIYSEAFDAIPAPAKDYIYRRLHNILTGRDRDPAFAGLTDEDRGAILEVLLATKTNLPEDWERPATGGPRE
jgi:hypothetical protein